MSLSVRLSVVCLSVCLSVTFMRPTQATEIFGNVSTPFGTLAICDLSTKILRRSSQGNPSVRGKGELNRRGIARYSDFGPLQSYIGVCKRVRQDELQTLRNETSDERDRMNAEVSMFTNTCSQQSAEIRRLNIQLEANTAALQVETPV